MAYHAEPIQTVLVTCRGQSEMMGKNFHRDNIITLDWHMPVSFKPPLYAISIGKTRFSHDVIASSKCFVVNFIDQGKREEALLLRKEQRSPYR
jgi:flavin reductase (DIM6/NTAB) family NADH-FMN oxidoreductase RutF